MNLVTNVILFRFQFHENRKKIGLNEHSLGFGAAAVMFDHAYMA